MSIRIAEETEPATPPSGKAYMYLDSADNTFKIKLDDGSVVTFSAASGDVVGPASATDNALARFNLTTGKLIQGSVVIVGDTGNMSGVADFAMTGAATIGTLSGVLKASTGVVSGSATTTDLPEGTNLYFTAERVDDRVAALVIAGTGITSTYDDTANTLTLATTITQYTDEMAQDAVGTILVDSSKIDFTYTDATPEITATIVAGSLVNADINASAAIDATKIADGSVTSTEFQYIGTLSSNAQTQLDGKAIGVASAIDSEVALFSGTGGKQLARATGTGVAHLTSGVLSASAVDLTTEVTGVLPIANGGTNSSSALSNNRVIISSGGALVEASAITANRAMVSNASGIPTHSATTDTQIGYLSTLSSDVQTQINAKQASDATLTALAAYNTNGLLTQTAADTFTGRTITGTTNRITVTNGDGVSGNPTISAPQDIHTGATPTFAGLLVANEGAVQLFEATGGGSNKISVKAPAALAADWTFTLPPDDGSSNQFLQTDGSGATIWAAAGGTSPLTTKGDVYTYSTVDARLPVGTNGQVLVADSAETTGLKWATVSGTGDVVGPSSATDNAIARYDSTTGKLIQNSGAFVDDSANVIGLKFVTTDDQPIKNNARKNYVRNSSATFDLSDWTSSGDSFTRITSSLPEASVGTGFYFVGDSTEGASYVFDLDTVDQARQLGISFAYIKGGSTTPFQMLVVGDASGAIVSLDIPYAPDGGYFYGTFTTGASDTEITLVVQSPGDNEEIKFSSFYCGPDFDFSATPVPIRQGGTNSSTTLNNNRVMISSGGSIVEHAALTASQTLLKTDGSGLPETQLLGANATYVRTTAGSLLQDVAMTASQTAVYVDGSSQFASVALTANRAVVSNGSSVLAVSTTSDTELDYVSGVTSSIQTQLNARVVGPGTVSDGAIMLFDGTTGFISKAATGSGPVKASSGVYSAGAIDLTTEVTGALPIANGGTNSGTALSNNRIMISSSGAIVEQSALTSGYPVLADSNGLPVTPFGPFADGTYNFYNDGVTTGQVTDITITSGIITNITVLP